MKLINWFGIATAVGGMLCAGNHAFAQGSSLGSFTYQGRLNDAQGPANGLFDFQFALFPESFATNNQVDTPSSIGFLAVTNGLFTVKLNFPQAVTSFDGNDRWLEIAIRPSGPGSNYATLSPRQQITAAPYAVRAANLTGTLPLSQLPAGVVTNNQTAVNLSGTFTGNGRNLTKVNAATLNGLTSAGFWSTNGNTGANPTNGAFLGTRDNLPLELWTYSERVLRLEPHFISPNVIGGHRGNAVSNGVFGGTIAGGGSSDFLNRVNGEYGAVPGGYGNSAAGRASTAMGFNTTARGHYFTAAGADTIAGGNSSVAMGNTVTASGNYSVALGNGTTASGESSTALGWGTTASQLGATALGAATEASGERSTAAGFVTTASGFCSTALGRGSIAAGDYSFAAGYSARANHPGSFVWADSTGGNFASGASDVFLVRASGGVGLGTGSPQGQLHVYSANNPTTLRIQSAATPGSGRLEFVSDPQGSANEWRPGYIQSTDNGGLAGGLSFVVNGAGADKKFGEIETMRIVNGRVGTVTATAFNPPSDRNLKENFSPVNPREVLEKVAALPISRWNFKGDTATPHVGPMAQDFHAAFALGTDERHIATVDADGVALAAIQGLNEKVEVSGQRTEDRVQKLEAENAELKTRLEKLEQLLTLK